MVFFEKKLLIKKEKLSINFITSFFKQRKSYDSVSNWHVARDFLM